MNTHDPVVLSGVLNYCEDDCAAMIESGAAGLGDENQGLPAYLRAEVVSRPDRIERLSDSESDCCAYSMPVKIAPPHNDSSLYIQSPGVYTHQLPQDFLLASSPYDVYGPSALNLPAWERWQSFRSPRMITRPVDWALAASGLLGIVGQPLEPDTKLLTTLTAWLHVTNACNLDCPYCYVPKSAASMDLATGVQAIDSIFKTAKINAFRQVKLKYAGGEPCLNFSLVKRLHERARQLAIENDISLREVLLSNGVLLREEDADWLVEHEVKLVISIDGVGKPHDHMRFRSGGGTFDHLANVLDRILLPRGIRPYVAMTVTRQNAHHAADMVAWAMLERKLPLSLNFYRQSLASATHPELALEEDIIIEGMLAAYARLEANIPVQPFFNGLLDRVRSGAHRFTCGVGQNYLVITHQGQIAQCQMQIDSPIGTIGQGNLLPALRKGAIQNIPVDAKEECRECQFRFLCSGGCPLETYRVTGRWDQRSPNCRIYKTLLPTALRLEGLRLMKVNGYLN